MIKDLLAAETNGEMIIETLVTDDTKDKLIRLWMPVMGMNLYSIGNDGVPRKLTAFRVRNLQEEREEEA